MKIYVSILLMLIFWGSCKSQKSHIGVRRDNRHELKIAAEAARKYTDGNFEITMYGDTAIIMGNKIIYKYEKELPPNKFYTTIPDSVKEGKWYWAAPIGFTIGVNDKEWVVVKDTSFAETGGLFEWYDSTHLHELEKLGVVKLKCNCR